MGSVLLGGARTPIGKFLGAFTDLPATELGGHAIAEALQRSGVDARAVDYVIMGQVLVSRADQDAFAARSHQRAAAATASGVMAEELVEVKVPQRRGPDRLVGADEGIREGVTAESLAGLRPAFGPDGTITAASSSPISDGAAALVVASAEAAERLGATPLAEIRAHGMVAGPDSSLQLQPAEAIRVACGKEQIGIGDLDLIEINEAFAAVGVASARALGLSAAETDERVNINGGAIALGHPIGASGARLVLTLAYGLRRRGGGTGVAGLCGGGGQGDALILHAAEPRRRCREYTRQ